MPVRRTLAACAAFLMLGAAPGAAATFDLVMSYTPAGATVTGSDRVARQSVGFSARQIELFGLAERFWETVLVGFSGRAAPSIAVTAAMTSIDGRYRTAAFAGPRSAEYVNGADPTSGAAKRFLRPTTGAMQFDAADFGAGGASEETFLAVAIHEISHTLGFGTLFGHNGLVGATPNRYVGRAAVAAFNATHGTSVTSLALDSSNGHWSECWVRSAKGLACTPESGRGGHNDSDVLTPFIAPGTATIAPATIAAFRDLGYLTIAPSSGIALPTATPTVAELALAPVPLPASGLLLIAAMGGFAALRRRRK